MRSTPAELVHESERSRVTRLYVDGRTVIRKEPLGRTSQHELAMLERLRGLDGVAQLVETPHYPGSIVMADAGEQSLADVPKPVAPVELIRLAVELARAVAGIHRRGVMHRDISPASIVLSAAGAPCLVGFGLATSLAEIRPEFMHHAEIVGTLAYVAPEQTGRTGRSVDQRADLYALGATLYELATGAPPFGFGDPLRLTHDHLARVPDPPAVPGPLAAVILRLLEKEPDRRYQSAEGLGYDLEHLRGGEPFEVGGHDVPLRLRPPSRLVGRDAEVAALEAAFAESECRGVFVAGAPGVGKTALVDALRPAVTGAGGWFVAGKFDQYRRDLEFDAVNQALRSLGRLLLAEPEAGLAELRAALLTALGANAGLLTAAVPEFAALLGVAPEPGDPLTAEARAQRAALQVLRAVASRGPLVVFLDDLQWAGRTPLGAVDLVLTEQPVEGLLVVGAYREGELDAARWHRLPGVRQLRLANLPGPAVLAMVAEMLRADPASTSSLAGVIGEHTGGNPYEVVELLNAMCRDGALTATAGGWRWQVPAVRARLLESEPGRMAAVRLEALTAGSRQLVEAMACLGGHADLSLLEVATGEPADVVEERLAPVLHEGLLVLERGAVRFSHDRAREVILDRFDPSTPQLELARRLARVPERFAAAAEQYLTVAGAVSDPAERRVAAELLGRAAGEAALIGDHSRVDALLAAAVELADPADTVAVVELRTRRHAALFSLGRLDEAEEEYRAIEVLCPSALGRADATAVRVRALTHRMRFVEAIELGLASLREHGIAVPAAGGFAAELDGRFERLHRWLDDPAEDAGRPELADPALLATSRLIDAVLPAGYFVNDPAMIAWLGLEALRLWIEHGPGPTLVGPVGHAAYHAGPQRGEYELGYRALERVVALGEARGYEPGTSQARHMLSAIICWFEPIEHGVQSAQRAREGLIGGDDLAYAGYTYQLSVPYLADCAPTLESFVAEVDGGLAFLRRTGNEQTGQWLDSYRWLAAVLRGERPVADESLPVERYAGNPLALLYAHLCPGIAAAVFDDPAGLAGHAAAAEALLAAAAGSYATAIIFLLRGLALAAQARAADEPDDLLAELDDATRWLATRAARAPDNFLHLLRLLEGERAWAAGDFKSAVLAYDAARREVAGLGRPWHRALIAERAARFLLSSGAEQAGYDALAEARREYLAWGATAKADRLDWAYATLRPQAGSARGTLTTGTIDLLGILSASRALSSETSLERLHARVAEVLGAMTGATGVHLTLWSAEREDWLDAGERTVPLTVLRYMRRIGEPIVVADAAGDDRFARDPYFAGVDCCALLAVPILSRGELRAALVLENRLIRGAFSAERLDAVQLIAGQLAVSLDNAQLYAELATSRARLVAAADDARRRIERDLHDGAQQRLVHTIIMLKLARRKLGDADGQAAELVAESLEHAERAIHEIRELAGGIHPRILSLGGIGPALETLTDRSPIPVAVDVRTDGRLPERVEVTAYYVVSEALTNAAKHSRATLVQVTADTTGDELRLTIADDGVGGADPTRGSGLVGLKDRVEALGGTLTVHSREGHGTRLEAAVPLTDPA